MAAIVFRCPATSQHVQHWLEDDWPLSEKEVYESVKCPACGRLHFVNRLTGKLLGQRETASLR